MSTATTPTGITWDEPPPTTTRWAQTLEPLREHPGRWARVAEHLTEPAARDRIRYLRNPHRSPINPNHWEFRAGRVQGRTDTYAWAVWARHTPPTTGDTTP